MIERENRFPYLEDMPIDVRQLKYFLAVAASQSFTGGAKKLHMAQAPLSKRIQELEAELGTVLFDRESRPIVLTPAGSLLHEEATRVVRSLDQLNETMHRFVRAEQTRFVLGLVPSTLYGRFPELIRRFCVRVPKFEIYLAEMGTLEQVVALREGRIDIGFDRVTADDPLVVHKLLRKEPLVAALPKNHALLHRKTPVRLAEITDIPLIIYPREPRPSYADLVLAIYNDMGLTPSRVIEVRELQTGLVMVAAGAGVCLVPESVRQLVRSDIGYVAIEATAAVPLFMRYRAGTPSPEFEELIRMFSDL